VIETTGCCNCRSEIDTDEC